MSGVLRQEWARKQREIEVTSLDARTRKEIRWKQSYFALLHLYLLIKKHGTLQLSMKGHGDMRKKKCFVCMHLWMKCTTLLTDTGIDFEEILMHRKSCSVLRHHFFIIVEIGRILSRTNQTNLVWCRFMGVNTGSGSRVDCSAAMSFPESAVS